MAAVELTEVLVGSSSLAPKLLPLMKPLLRVVASHTPRWVSLLHVRERAAVTLLQLVRTVGKADLPITRPGAREALLAPLMQGSSVAILLASAKHGTYQLTGACTAVLAELTLWPSWRTAFLGTTGVLVRTMLLNCLADSERPAEMQLAEHYR